ncbi:DNA polymerase III subunit beta [Bartonella sp. TP]|uniref:DNA polymerase III subunit beta n=1 Tax=Bartonella sp. TP TaxID=3057550 RepID=UPI0025AFAAB6|nr:DNA polymerase III subunit beta [Bartonella sp. TP]WJW80418.1 DNA polymerase III subunit beta [Bartonella sp. TP]
MMRISVDRNNFLKSLGHVYRIVDRRNTASILGNVLIKANGELIQLKATDLELQVSEELAANIEQPGSATVPAYLLYDVIRRLPAGAEVKIELNNDNGQVRIISGRVNYKLQSLPASDFPDSKSVEWQHSFTLSAKELRPILNATQSAISTDETRYCLNGIYMHIVRNKDDVPMLRLVATDGHRLSVGELAAPDNSLEMPGLIIPRKAVLEMQKMLAEGFAQDIAIDICETKIGFTVGDLSLVSKLIDGQFPDYEKIIPSDHDKFLTVDREEFIASVGRVSVVSNDYARALKFDLDMDNLRLSMESLDADSAEDCLNCHYRGEVLEIGFNAKYLLDEASQFTQENIIFSFSNSSSPCVMRDGEKTTILYILMPMRL